MCIKDKCVVLSLLVLIIVSSLGFYDILASEDYFELTGHVYEKQEDDKYDFSNSLPVNSTVYGKSKAGSLTVSGNIDIQSTFRGTEAYGVTGPVKITYSVEPSLYSDIPENWVLYSNSEKRLVDADGVQLDFDEKMRMGSVVVQKSTDNYTWSTVKIISDFYNNEESDNQREVYTIPENEYVSGTYYRIYIVYQVRRRIEEPNIFNIGLGEYERKNYLETYNFYVCFEKNPVVLRDIIHGLELPVKGSSKSGFVIDKMGANVLTTVTRDDGEPCIAENYSFFTDKGEYRIEITSNLGKKYYYSISVDPGIKLYNLQPEVFESDDNKGYIEENKLEGHTVFNSSSYTALSIGNSADKEMFGAKIDSIPGYGIVGDSVSLFLEIKNDANLNNSSWILNSDEWGRNENELVNGVQTGMVASGALIIQTSLDGTNWVNANRERYSKGLYTTDFGSNYGTGKKVLVYTPKGEDIINGLYFRIFYAYEMVNKNTNEVKDYLEKYTFYLCNGDLSAVTFHNLSLEGKLESLIDSDDYVQMAMYKSSETLLDGAYTVTGFEIDTTLNPIIKKVIKRNGSFIPETNDNKYTETGKYEITMTSAIGNQKTITLYVDKLDDKEAIRKYFGTGFIQGKRIYSERELPVFEAGATKWHIEKKDSNYSVLQGTIVNNTTGDKKEIQQLSTEQNVEIDSAGEYIVTLSTNPDYNNKVKSGDSKTYIFRFVIIEKGMAPGPVINREILEQYSCSTMIDSKPIYYGLTYQSAGSGYITMVYDNYSDAFKASYDYQKGLVELQEDGKVRYIGKSIFHKKVIYESNWNLTEACNYYAEKAIERSCFDISNPSTFYTLSDDTLKNTQNLRSLELENSVFVFANTEQKEKLTCLESLPLINDKICYYLKPGRDNQPEKKTLYYSFKRDKYGTDSFRVMITDKNDKKYYISYDESVEKQLNQKKCPSGVINITESTIYGDTNTYQAIYIAKGDNTSSIKIKYLLNDTEYENTINQNNCETVIDTDGFWIISTDDELDPYGLIKVKSSDGDCYYYSMNDGVVDENGEYIKWDLNGKYEITCTNRLGYSYSVNVNVVNSEKTVIKLVGDGTLELDKIMTSIEDKDVLLPMLERYGYIFKGYKDEQTGIVYTDRIPEVKKSGFMELEALWEPKKVHVYLKNANGQIIKKDEVDFGKIYLVPDYNTSDTELFEGWTIEGKILEENYIIPEKEEDIVITASCSKVIQDNNMVQDDSNLDNIEINEDSDKAEKDENIKTYESDSHIYLWVTISVLFLIFIVIFVMIIFKKRKNNSAKLS